MIVGDKCACNDEGGNGSGWDRGCWSSVPFGVVADIEVAHIVVTAFVELDI